MSKKLCLLCVIIALITGCDNTYFPKPRGYFRIDLPSKKYRLFDSIPFPYMFSYPEYTMIEPDKERADEPFWINIHYLPFDATLYLSYKKVKNNLNVYIDDAHTFVTKHIPKATGINENVYMNEPERVFGLIYNIEGADVASPMQFYLTDSTTHYVRGSLYFNNIPNNDSLAPVIEFIKQDIYYMFETFKWRK
ncbi:MAG: hypothetical protein BWY70_01056 [Bacteroidetes bacterium ADurb.Bin408]|nr:MAG: hypothetical protein BWY70_01056 [Bacteroidetes bacterium ADurb.Bin408]